MRKGGKEREVPRWMTGTSKFSHGSRVTIFSRAIALGARCGYRWSTRNASGIITHYYVKKGTAACDRRSQICFSQTSTPENCRKVCI